MGDVTNAKRSAGLVGSAAVWLLVFFLALGVASDGFAQARKKKKLSKPKAVPCKSEGCKAEAVAPEPNAASPEDEAKQRELAELARALHADAKDAYKKLAAFNKKNADNVWGARAALALGYADYTKKHHKEALAWFAKAGKDKLLGDYALYWSAQTHRAMKRLPEALEELRAVQRDYPSTPMREQLLDALANTATDLRKPQEALAALDAYAISASRSDLLLDHARARRAARQLPQAAADYQTIYYKFPLSDEASAAGSALGQLQKEMRSEYPRPSIEWVEKRAQAFFDAKKWHDARVEFEKLLAQSPQDPADPMRQRAQLRIAQARIQLDGPASLLTTLNLTDPDLDAERMVSLAQYWRSKKHESQAQLLSVSNALMEKYPDSRWVEEIRMGLGNYYWVQLDRARAAEYYKRLLEAFPVGKYAQTAEWRTVWVAYLNRQPNVGDLLQAYVEKNPTAPYIVNALYWLGRTAEREGNPAHARSFYNKAVARFGQTYFGFAAALRLAAIGPGEENPAQFLDKIPPPAPLVPIDAPVPPAAAERWARAQVLRAIAFDASAEQELKFAYFATGAPRLLVEAAQSAFDQGHFAVGMAYARLAVPNSEARKKDDVPLSAWKALYPLPYEATLRREAAKNGLDAAVVAGLIRQESTFDTEAVSRAGACGLMQVLPSTGKQLAKQLHLHYAQKKLFDPEFNLTLGTVYFKALLRSAGGPEQALAAYNAGEDRIAFWSAERKFEEIPELVESIPFTETREYVQIVLRNAEAYRMIYGAPGPATPHLPARQ
jgi:soluble lytic murein transglycosylase